MPAELRETEALVVFLDISRFMSVLRRHAEIEVTQQLNEFYRKVSAAVTGAHGTVVKYLGDGALVFFEREHADTGVVALLGLQQDVDHWLAGLGWDCRLKVQAHYGVTVAGTFDDGIRVFFDVFGATVNTAATLQSAGFSLSAQAFRQLTPSTRNQFKKHTESVTYIHIDDSHAKVRAAP
jgi:adenylate cyclase